MNGSEKSRKINDDVLAKISLNYSSEVVKRYGESRQGQYSPTIQAETDSISLLDMKEYYASAVNALARRFCFTRSIIRCLSCIPFLWAPMHKLRISSLIFQLELNLEAKSGWNLGVFYGPIHLESPENRFRVL